MGHYITNVRDIEFNLFEVLGLQSILERGDYGDLDADTAKHMLAEAARLAEGPIADSFASTDRNPPEFLSSEHAITVPEGLATSVKAIHEAQWWRLGLAPELGGVRSPSPLTWAIAEMINCANPAVVFFCHGPLVSDVLYKLGNEQQKHWAQVALDRGWSATMALTEADAGSDVGAGRTRAIRQPDGSWHLEGVKRFISGADTGDIVENVFHMVLARPVGADPGTKGLSLFFVPKFLFDPETGELGPRNGAFVTNLEHKMGLKGSPTCELTLGGSDVPAVGYLVGDRHDGIAQMFNLIEHARMSVGVKGAGTLSTAYLNALAYAKTREQGPDLARMMDKTAPRVTITHHPDVRRSLMLQKAYAEGLRSLYLYTAMYKCDGTAELLAGVDTDFADRINDLLLPVVKAVSADRAYEMMTESLQTLGGSGYLQDYPIEQYIRDSKIDSVYEGTTAIQALDFIFRKIVRDQARAFGYLTDQIKTFADADGALGAEREALGTALGEVTAMSAALLRYLTASQQNPDEVYKIGLVSVRFLHAFGGLVIGWRLLAGAEIAAMALDRGADERDASFYQGKIAAASFFASTVLPRLSSDRAVVETVNTDIMELDEAAF